MSALRTAGGGSRTQTAHALKKKKAGCSCGYDAATGKCCSTGRCGCRKNGQACGSDCSCARPACKCDSSSANGDGDHRAAVLRQVKKAGPNTGRHFWCCSRGPDDAAKCDFFCWEKAAQGRAVGSADAAAASGSSSSSGCSGGVCNSADVGHRGPWSCAACTFANPAAAQACEICSTARPAAPTSGSSCSSGGGAAAPVYSSPCTNQFGLALAATRAPAAAGTGTGTAGGGAKRPATGGKGGVRKRKRKLCERGADCPYKHEYQHGLEFSHDDDDNDGGSGGGGGSSSFTPFGGSGRKLGA